MSRRLCHAPPINNRTQSIGALPDNPSGEESFDVPSNGLYIRPPYRKKWKRLPHIINTRIHILDLCHIITLYEIHAPLRKLAIPSLKKPGRLPRMQNRVRRAPILAQRQKGHMFKLFAGPGEAAPVAEDGVPYSDALDAHCLDFADYGAEVGECVEPVCLCAKGGELSVFDGLPAIVDE